MTKRALGVRWVACSIVGLIGLVLIATPALANDDQGEGRHERSVAAEHENDSKDNGEEKDKETGKGDAHGASQSDAAPETGGAPKSDPPGNNGTVKIDAAPFDTHPDNEPHVGCSFQVDFYGFDKGDLYADVVFAAHPPTGRGEILLEDRVFIGEDDHSGGGSEAGLDAEKTYDLSAALASFTPHPKQGYHVKLTVHADGSQGADTKHKVFWVEDCGQPATAAVGGTTSGPKDAPAPAVESQVLSSGTQVGAPSGSAVGVAGESTVLGEVLTRPAPAGTSVLTSSAPAAAGAPSGVLAFTGSHLLPLALVGAGLVLVGTLAMAARRRSAVTL